MTATPLDAAWLAANPLRLPDGEVDKNSRGKVLAVGGSLTVPGAIGLVAEAALRAGAGKAQIGVPAPAAIVLATLRPELAAVAMPVREDGELARAGAEALRPFLDQCDTLVLGPGMGRADAVRPLVRVLLGEVRESLSVVLDAAAIACAGRLAKAIAAHGGRLVMTPHHGEMARLMECGEDAVAADDEELAATAAEKFGAVIVLKSARTVIAAPGGTLLRYAGGGVGLATAGSGDVLAGILGGLLARGTPPLAAAGWAVWLHGQAGRRLADRIGPIGFLAGELAAEVPRLMR